jgi:hypothetical protein
MGDDAVDFETPVDEIISSGGVIFVGAGIERAVGLEDERDVGGAISPRKLDRVRFCPTSAGASFGRANCACAAPPTG